MLRQELLDSKEATARSEHLNKAVKEKLARDKARTVTQLINKCHQNQTLKEVLAFRTRYKIIIFNSGLVGVEALEAGGRGGEVGQGAEREGGGGAQGIEGARGLDHPLHGREETIAGEGLRVVVFAKCIMK